jgi:hypothetical protein
MIIKLEILVNINEDTIGDYYKGDPRSFPQILLDYCQEEIEGDADLGKVISAKGYEVK